MENLEILKGIVSDETYAVLEAETKDSKIRLGDLSTDKYVSADKYKDLEKQLGKVNSTLTEKTTEYDTLKEKAGDKNFLFTFRIEQTMYDKRHTIGTYYSLHRKCKKIVYRLSYGLFQSTLPVKGATAKVNKYSILFLSNIISFARI